jgi:hypothetical protein
LAGVLVLIVSGALSWSAPALGQTPNRTTPSLASPEIVVRSFYKWYISSLKRKVEPFKERKTELKQFVTTV